MALSQLITTVDIANNNIGIGNSVAEGATYAVALGLQQNVGIGTNAPLTGLHIATAEGSKVIPGLYLSDAAEVILPTIAANDGIFSVVAGVPTFTNAFGSQILTTSAPNVTGAGTLVDGTVTIEKVGVTASSVILLTRTTTTGDVTTIGTLNAVAGTDEFVVNSTVATDVGSFNYLIVG